MTSAQRTPAPTRRVRRSASSFMLDRAPPGRVRLADLLKLRSVMYSSRVPGSNANPEGATTDVWTASEVDQLCRGRVFAPTDLESVGRGLLHYFQDLFSSVRPHRARPGGAKACVTIVRSAVVHKPALHRGKLGGGGVLRWAHCSAQARAPPRQARWGRIDSQGRWGPGAESWLGVSAQAQAPPTQGRWGRSAEVASLVVHKPALHRHKVGGGGSTLKVGGGGSTGKCKTLLRGRGQERLSRSGV
jgi:hypothetical protein